MRSVWDNEGHYEKVLFGKRHKVLSGESIEILSGNEWHRFGSSVDVTRNSKVNRKRRQLVGGKR